MRAFEINIKPFDQTKTKKEVFQELKDKIEHVIGEDLNDYTLNFIFNNYISNYDHQKISEQTGKTIFEVDLDQVKLFQQTEKLYENLQKQLLKSIAHKFSNDNIKKVNLNEVNSLIEIKNSSERIRKQMFVESIADYDEQQLRDVIRSEVADLLFDLFRKRNVWI